MREIVSTDEMRVFMMFSSLLFSLFIGLNCYFSIFLFILYLSSMNVVMKNGAGFERKKNWS